MDSQTHELWRRLDRQSRRRFLGGLAASLAGVGISPWLPALAAAAPQLGQATEKATGKARHCVLLWMTGGPSQCDTFDMKPGHANGGSFQEIATAAAGLRFSEHLPRLARQAKRLAVPRGLSTGEGDHGRGTYLMRTGRRPEAELRFPTLGSLVSKEIGRDDARLPNFVSVNPFLEFNADAYQSGFLGPRYAALDVKPKNPQTVPTGFAELGVDNLHTPPGRRCSAAGASAAGRPTGGRAPTA